MVREDNRSLGMRIFAGATNDSGSTAVFDQPQQRKPVSDYAVTARRREIEHAQALARDILIDGPGAQTGRSLVAESGQELNEIAFRVRARTHPIAHHDDRLPPLLDRLYGIDRFEETAGRYLIEN